ncbi:MAG TPA: hypothetical protein VGC89_15245 [Pyrinomonadaceae bacterium]
MSLIAACFVGALLCLHFIFGNGAISSENQSAALFKLLGFYIPLLTLVATFFFVDKQGGANSKTPKETFFVALFITGLWVLTPIFLMLAIWFIEDVLDYLDKLIPVGQSLALMALGYYFTKQSKA